MIDTVLEYGMFTPEGEQAVQCVVNAARHNGWSWKETYSELCQLARDDRFDEALDTAVREQVYSVLGFYEQGQDFYV
jgi:hypothetical protein